MISKIWRRLWQYDKSFYFMRTMLRHHAKERGIAPPKHLEHLARRDARRALRKPVMMVVVTLDWLEAFALEMKPFGYVNDNAAIDQFLKAVRLRISVQPDGGDKQ